MSDVPEVRQTPPGAGSHPAFHATDDRGLQCLETAGGVVPTSGNADGMDIPEFLKRKGKKNDDVE